MRSRTQDLQDIWLVTITESVSGIDTVKTYGTPVHYFATVSATAGLPVEVSAGLFPNSSRYIVSMDRNFNPAIGTGVFVDRTPVITAGTLTNDPDYVIVDPEKHAKGVVKRYGIKEL